MQNIYRGGRTWYSVNGMDILLDGLCDFLQETAFIDDVIQKFHYLDEDREGLCAVSEKLSLLVRDELRCRHRLFVVSTALSDAAAPDGGIQYAEVVITLGKGVDALQDEYCEKGLLTEAYMVEALSSELLLRAYQLYNANVKDSTGLHVARYHFWGAEDAYPLEHMLASLNRLDAGVVCNENLYMIPKKSVAFVAQHTLDERVSCEGICNNCNNLNCPNRMTGDKNRLSLWGDMANMPLTYGYTRIFGKKNGNTDKGEK